jgi:hypothetical protein
MVIDRTTYLHMNGEVVPQGIGAAELLLPGAHLAYVEGVVRSASRADVLEEGFWNRHAACWRLLRLFSSIGGGRRGCYCSVTGRRSAGRSRRGGRCRVIGDVRVIGQRWPG